MRGLLTSEFSKLGYKTISAIDGEDALVKLNAEKVQVVITDMKMSKLEQTLVELESAKKEIQTL
jgi:DNA-binding NtrC family response regulator